MPIKSNEQERTVHVLIVEDDDVDREAILRGFHKHGITSPLTTVANGLEALYVLRGENGYTRLPRPYLILLDINMPRMSGLEFLTEIRKDEELKSSIVFVLSTSARTKDMVAAYEKQVAGYLLKARAGEDFINLASLLDSYRRTVEFPPETH